MRATFLGHQGWIIQSDQTTILIDPLLDGRFGQHPEAGLQVYPPRQLDFTRLPPVDAVFLSHEHDDHFQLASLTRIARDVPVFLSDRSSWAAERVLRDLEFSVERVGDGIAIEIGDLRLFPFGAALTDADGFHDEWDVMTYGVCQEGQPGAFYSSVDVARPPAATAWLESQAGPSVVTFTNNLTTMHAFRSWGAPPPGPLSIIGELVHWFTDGSPPGRRPHLVLGVGGGWSYTGASAWMNQRAFPADNRLVEAALAAAGLAATVPFRAVQPGDTVDFTAGGPILRAGACPFLTCRPPEAWPDRRFDRAPDKVAELVPLLEGAPLGGAEIARLEHHLAELARDLVGSRFFFALLSLARGELQGKRPHYLLSLGSRGGDDLLYEYAPAQSGFRRTERDIQLYAAGGGCWAGDLLALLEGRVNAAAFTFGHFFEWVSCPTAKPHLLSLSDQLWKSVHPLRRPQVFYQAYRRRVDELGDGDVAVFGRARPPARVAAGGRR